MTQAALLTIPGATPGTTQWRAESLQMVNWGGFHGYVNVPFARDATLLSGASGTGKSTLLDAYIAVMMPSDTAFNGASNDATAGRVRGSTQRNLLTYLRGKTDTTREETTGDLHDQVLRGRSGPVWGALAMTFIDDNGKRFVAGRIYTVPAAATAPRDVTGKMVTVEARLDLRDLADLASTGFDKLTLERRFPALTVHRTYERFAQKLFDRLGIGANGDGAKALRLLARIQGGQRITSVDGLYKQMVLEAPATYRYADDAVNDFTSVQETYRQMVTAGEKAKLLERLPKLWADRADALEKAKLLDTFGVHRDGPTPLLRWQLDTEANLLDIDVDKNRSGFRDASARHAAAQDAVARLKLQLTENEQAQRDNDGERLKTLTSEIGVLTGQESAAREERDTFNENTRVLGIDPASEADLAAAKSAAEQFLAACPARDEELQREQNELQEKAYPLLDRRKAIGAELTSLRQRKSLIEAGLHEARAKMAAAAGLRETDLPFVAELIDIAPDAAEWRHAAEVAWHAVARVVLVDARSQEHLSRSINSIRMRRLNFTGVDLTPHAQRRGRDGYLSGALLFKDSPFSAWVHEKMTSRGVDARCIDRVEDLAGPERRITVSGQTRQGRDGAHGDYNAKPIIGFDNTELIASYETELEDVDKQLGQLNRAATALGAQRKALGDEQSAHIYVRATRWATIDVASVAADIAVREAEKADLLAGSDVLGGLVKRHAELTEQLDAAREKKTGAKLRCERLDEEHGKLCTRQDEVATGIGELDDNGVTVTAEQAVYLDAAYAEVADPADLTGLPAGFKRLRDALRKNVNSERNRSSEAEQTLTEIFRQYQEHTGWYDPSRGTTIADYDAYKQELDQVTYDRLDELKDVWRRRLIAWTGDRLVPLNGAFDGAIDEIRERLTPINEILAGLPFGAGHDRLEIDLRQLAAADVGEFRREVKALSSGVTGELTDAQAAARYRRLDTLMTTIGKPDGGRQSAARDALLDVRRHIEITAVRLNAAGERISTYAWLGDKSGGETQELVAFIVGAALRFQLGDEDRARPRFAPIFLDEGFVKADSEFAGRAVAAWLGLGFQLIVGAPLDKVTALEPAMQLVLSVTKSTSGYSYVTDMLSRGQPR